MVAVQSTVSSLLFQKHTFDVASQVGVDPTLEAADENCSILDHHVQLWQNISARKIIADPPGNPGRIDQRLKRFKVVKK